MKAVILAAGRSERLNPFTETRAKSMIRVAGLTILETLLGALKDVGVTEVTLVVNHMRQGIEQTFQHGAPFGMSLDYVVQEKLDGIGAALARCEPNMSGEPFLLVYGDVLTTGQPFRPVLEQYAEAGGAVAALTLPKSSGEFGNVYLDNDMRITQLVEKPENPHLSNYVFAGIFLLPGTIFDLLRKTKNDMEATFQSLIASRNLTGTLWDGNWIDIRRPWQILEANRMLMDLWDRAEIHASVRMEGSVHIEGPVRIEADVVLGAGTVLKGPCYIGRGSYIGNNALIRSYTSLGPESVVGFGTELKDCVLFGRSVLGRLSFIGDSVIGEGVHLGTGVTTVNYREDGTEVVVETEEGRISTGMLKVGAFIGDRVVIGARHVLAPGTRIRSNHVEADRITLNSVV
ncbi:MAG: sugar phosphate nucleotidyltransferase [Deltaproteobacteria bacterium]|nr:sugar phosphate nucleotidyltransferase [Deltaproteobacteria bacterium]